MCQSAFAIYFSRDVEKNPWKSIQDVRTLKEMNHFIPSLLMSPWDEVLKHREALQLSSAEESCVRIFLIIWSGLDVFNAPETFRVKTMTGTWKNSRGKLDEILRDFLDNEKYWGDACHRKVRESRFRMRLAGTTTGRQLLDQIDKRSIYLDSSAYRS